MEKKDLKLLADLESAIQNLRSENDPADPENPEIGDLTAFQIAYDVPMADHTSFRAGGHAAAMVHVGTNLELKTTLRCFATAATTVWSSKWRILRESCRNRSRRFRA